MQKKWYEVVIEGSFDLIKGFIIGFFEGRNITGAIVFEREHHIKYEDGLEQLLRMIHIEEDQAHILMNEETFQMLDQALDNRKYETHLKIVSKKEIVRAHFNFTYEAYAKRFGDELKDLFNNLPEEIQLEGYQPEEIERDTEDSTAGYAPLHKYEIKAEGRVSGPTKSVIDFYDKLERNELIDLEEIEMEFQE